MNGAHRPQGIAAIALSGITLGVILTLLFFFSLPSPPFNLATLVFGILFIGLGLATWVGMKWVWYLLTFGGGLFGWYYAKNEVKEFFGIEDNVNESGYTGD
jgi:hypothetical protein